MLAADLLRAVLVAALPVLFACGQLSVWMVYVVAFAQTTLRIFFDAGDAAVVARLVPGELLVTANGRLQASYAATGIAGTALTGAFVLLTSPSYALLLDSGSFLVSAVSLLLIRQDIGSVRRGEKPAAEPFGRLLASVGEDIREGLRYVWAQPLLRTVSIVMAVANLFGAAIQVELLFFAKVQLSASNSQVAFLFAAGGVGIVLFSMLAGPIRRRFGLSPVALTCLAADAVLIIVLSQLTNYWAAGVIWLVKCGLDVLFNINTASLRQQLVPDRLMGRVMTVASVVAWSAVPIGSLAGGLIVAATGNVAAVYLGVGIIGLVVAALAAFSPLAHARRHLPEPTAAVPATAGQG
jgi:hypothetical protein